MVHLKIIFTFLSLLLYSHLQVNAYPIKWASYCSLCASWILFFGLFMQIKLEIEWIYEVGNMNLLKELFFQVMSSACQFFPPPANTHTFYFITYQSHIFAAFLSSFPINYLLLRVLLSRMGIPCILCVEGMYSVLFQQHNSAYKHKSERKHKSISFLLVNK